ncbi:MAG: hypothetical protein ACI861_000727, partial [Paracoccaceae bacterium]
MIGHENPLKLVRRPLYTEILSQEYSQIGAQAIFIQSWV